MTSLNFLLGGGPPVSPRSRSPGRVVPQQHLVGSGCPGHNPPRSPLRRNCAGLREDYTPPQLIRSSSRASGSCSDPSTTHTSLTSLASSPPIARECISGTSDLSPSHRLSHRLGINIGSTNLSTQFRSSPKIDSEDSSYDAPGYSPSADRYSSMQINSLSSPSHDPPGLPVAKSHSRSWPQSAKSTTAKRRKRASRARNSVSTPRPRKSNTPWTAEDTATLMWDRDPDNANRLSHAQCAAKLERTPQGTRLHHMQTLMKLEYRELATRYALRLGYASYEAWYERENKKLPGGEKTKRDPQRPKQDLLQPSIVTQSSRRDASTGLAFATPVSTPVDTLFRSPSTPMSRAQDDILRHHSESHATDLAGALRAQRQRQNAFAMPSQISTPPHMREAEDVAVQSLIAMSTSRDVTISPSSRIRPEDQLSRFGELAIYEKGFPPPGRLNRADFTQMDQKRSLLFRDDNQQRSNQSYDDRMKSNLGLSL